MLTPSFYLSQFILIYLSIYLSSSVHSYSLCSYLSIYLSIYLSLFKSISVYSDLSIYLSIYLSISDWKCRKFERKCINKCFDFLCNLWVLSWVRLCSPPFWPNLVGMQNTLNAFLQTPKTSVPDMTLNNLLVRLQ